MNRKIIYAKKRENNFLNNAKHKIILCKIVEIVYTENSEQFLINVEIKFIFRN